VQLIVLGASMQQAMQVINRQFLIYGIEALLRGLFNRYNIYLFTEDLSEAPTEKLTRLLAAIFNVSPFAGLRPS
jgi:hypothetical protein